MDLFPGGLWVEGEPGAEKSGGVAEEFRIVHFLLHIEHKLLIGWGSTSYKPNIPAVTTDDLIGIDFCILQRVCKVKKVASLLALIQGSHFGAE